MTAAATAPPQSTNHPRQGPAGADSTSTDRTILAALDAQTRLTAQASRPSWWCKTMISRTFERPERTAKRANDTSNRYRTRHIGPQDASASCLVSAHDRILDTHREPYDGRLSRTVLRERAVKGGFVGLSSGCAAPARRRAVPPTGRGFQHGPGWHRPLRSGTRRSGVPCRGFRAAPTPTVARFPVSVWTVASPVPDLHRTCCWNSKRPGCCGSSSTMPTSCRATSTPTDRFRCSRRCGASTESPRGNRPDNRDRVSGVALRLRVVAPCAVTVRGLGR